MRHDVTEITKDRTNSNRKTIRKFLRLVFYTPDWPTEFLAGIVILPHDLPNVVFYIFTHEF